MVLHAADEGVDTLMSIIITVISSRLVTSRTLMQTLLPLRDGVAGGVGHGALLAVL